MSAGDLCWIAGLALLLLGWLLPRWAAATRLKISPALVIDLLLPSTVFIITLALSARPLLAGTVTLALGAGWARADADKRRVLAEPIVFTDIFQAIDIARHPNLALPFPHKMRIALAALAVIIFFVLVVRLEPAAWASPWCSLAVFTAGLAALWAVGQGLLHWLARHPQVLTLSADPTQDSAAHGALATILLHGFFAGFERNARRAKLAPHATASPLAAADCGPVVLVQNESFFDARRLHPGIPTTLLPHFDRACRDGVQWGRFGVPSWGANTVRTEFAVLSGLTQNELGFDRFNPYHRFADQPIASLASALRAEGYHTVCLHPFDRRFYRRDQVLPNLGFDEFLGEELFEHATRINGYVSDVDVAHVAARIIRERGPKLFLFIITIENHGPWSGAPDRQIGDLAALPLDAEERLGLNHYLSSLVHADEMLGILREALAAQPQPAVLGFYGDHLPSFPSVFKKLGLQGSHSDYLIWRTHGGTGLQQELAATGLAECLLSIRIAEKR